jgi:hypothetical protein
MSTYFPHFQSRFDGGMLFVGLTSWQHLYRHSRARSYTPMDDTWHLLNSSYTSAVWDFLDVPLQELKYEGEDVVQIGEITMNEVRE